jgi:uridine kinase
MSNRIFRSIASFCDDLKVFPRKQRTLIVGIDGCGGSGKSTFARALQNACSGVVTVHMDDFYFPSSQRQTEWSVNEPIGANFDWRRLQREVLLPLAGDTPAKYQRYDWPRDSLAEWIGIEIGGIAVIEGVYSTRAELRSFYDYRIFVDCPRELRIARGVERDGEAARPRWENDWCPAEDAYIELHAPHQHANLILDGAGRASVNPQHHFIASDAVPS